MQDSVSHIDTGLALKRPGARQHFVKQHTGGKDIGARVAFVRNRPVGLDLDLDAELLRLHDDA